MGTSGILVASYTSMKRATRVATAMLACIAVAACSGGGSSSKVTTTTHVVIPKGATTDTRRLLDTQWALLSVNDARGHALLMVRRGGPSPGGVAFPYRGSGLFASSSTVGTGPKPTPHFIWDVCKTGTGPLHASNGTIDTRAIVVNNGQCWNQYPYMANRIPAQKAFTRVISNRTHRIEWFVDQSGELHLVSPLDGESLIFGQSSHG